MDESELAGFYASAYRHHQQATENPIKKDLLMQEARAVSTISLIKHKVPAIKHHLDIGSSSGALLREVRRYYQCKSVGLEPGEAYRQYSMALGDRIYPDKDALSEAGEDQFDFISMMHVLEHIPDPVSYLTDLRENILLLKGYLLIEVPNLFEHASFELPHLYAFSAHTLREVLRQAGYHVLLLKTHGGFRSPILKLYITALAIPLEHTKPPRKLYLPGAFGIRLRRRLGTIKRNFFTRHWPDWTWQAPP